MRPVDLTDAFATAPVCGDSQIGNGVGTSPVSGTTNEVQAAAGVAIGRCFRLLFRESAQRLAASHPRAETEHALKRLCVPNARYIDPPGGGARRVPSGLKVTQWA